MKETREDKLRVLEFEELMLRGKLIDVCLTYGNPRTNKLFPINKRMTSMAELMECHAADMPKDVVAAYKKLLQMRQLLVMNGVELPPL